MLTHNIMSLETIRSKVRPLGLSDHGARWLEQALYPPGDLTRVAIPTRTHYPTLRIEYRPTAVVSKPYGLEAGNWDLILLSLPGDATPLVWCSAPSGADFRAASIANSDVGFLSSVPALSGLPDDLTVQSRVADGTATSVNYPRLINPMRHTGFRTTSKSYTAHMTASSLYNSGSVTTCQVDSTWQQSPGLRQVGSKLLSPALGTIPLTEDEQVSMSPYSVVGEAKDGVFVPVRLLGPDFSFARSQGAYGKSCAVGLQTLQVSDGATSGSCQTVGVMPTLTTAHGSMFSSQNPDIPGWLSGALATATKIDDTAYDKVATAVTIFRGLNHEATVTLTVHVSYEMILSSVSPFRTLAGEPDVMDSRALAAYFEIAARMPHAYPASYNALGLVIPAIGAALKGILPHLPKLLPAAASLAAGFLQPAPSAQSAGQSQKTIPSQLGSWARQQLDSRLERIEAAERSLERDLVQRPNGRRPSRTPIKWAGASVARRPKKKRAVMKGVIQTNLKARR